MQCEALDKLEEFTLFIRHCFCLLGVATLLSHGRCVIAPPRPAPPRKVCLSASWRNPCSLDERNAVFVSRPVEIVWWRRLGAARESGGGRQRQRQWERQGDYGPVHSPSMVSVPT